MKIRVTGLYRGVNLSRTISQLIRNPRQPALRAVGFSGFLGINISGDCRVDGKKNIEKSLLFILFITMKSGKYISSLILSCNVGHDPPRIVFGSLSISLLSVHFTCDRHPQKSHIKSAHLKFGGSLLSVLFLLQLGQEQFFLTNSSPQSPRFWRLVLILLLSLFTLISYSQSG